MLGERRVGRPQAAGHRPCDPPPTSGKAAAA